MKKLFAPVGLCLLSAALTGCVVVNVGRDTPARDSELDSRAGASVTGAVGRPQTFNIDFGPWRPAPSKQVGPAAAGRAGDYWNTVGVPWNDAHTESELRFATGEPSPIQVEMINLGGGWSNSGQMGVKSPMLDNYSYPANNKGGDSKVILHRVPAGKYDVYAYGHATNPVYYGDYTLTVGNRNYGRKTTSHELDAVENTEWIEDSQYVKFIGVSVASGEKLEILIQPGGEVNISGRTVADAMICGLQLVPVR